MQAHGAALRLRTKDPILVGLLQANYDNAELEPREGWLRRATIRTLSSVYQSCSRQPSNASRRYSPSDMCTYAETIATARTTTG